MDENNLLQINKNNYLITTTTTTTQSPFLFLSEGDHQQQQPLDTWRVPPSLFAVFAFFYAAVFFGGFVGNMFVVVAIATHKSLRTGTDWIFVASLAFADLLILLICLPSTLLNNVLTEWQLGSFGCKLSVWLNSTTSCASIFTLVGVTGERYLAICHPLKQLKMKSSHLQFYIVGIWLLSAALASPNLWVYREILYDLLSRSESINLNEGLIARLCVDTSENFWLFIVINLLIAFLVPIIIISFLYFCIFRVISRHTEKRLAVDNGARVRDERVKLRIAQMMFTVIVVFVLCWTPLYGLYCYFFMAGNKDSSFFQFASSWLSLLSSSLNPLIYICFSQKYRRAFHQLLLLPCRKRYRKIQRATRNTFRLNSSAACSERPSSATHLLLQNSAKSNGHLPLSKGHSYTSATTLKPNNRLARGSLDVNMFTNCNNNKLDINLNQRRPSSAVVTSANFNDILISPIQQQKWRRKESEQINEENKNGNCSSQILMEESKENSELQHIPESKKEHEENSVEIKIKTYEKEINTKQLKLTQQNGNLINSSEKIKKENNNEEGIAKPDVRQLNTLIFTL
uniref:G-protein coupled receptors family 1 profile domain-containing protein n=1 Tax=Meloidogyne incognita TaxID=6306 RepID=A0A914LWN2_MELIC